MITTFLLRLFCWMFPFIMPAKTANLTIKPLIIVTVTKPVIKKKKRKFRWKQVFRPFKIFKKKISFWWLLFFGIATLLGISFLLLDNSSLNLEGIFVEAIFYLLAGIFSISAILTLLILITLPILFIIRIIKELKWSKRYEKCVS